MRPQARLRNGLLLMAAAAFAAVAAFAGLTLVELRNWDTAFDALVSDNHQASLDGDFHAALTRAVGETASYSLTGMPKYRKEADQALQTLERTLAQLNELGARRGRNANQGPEANHQLLLGRQTALYLRVKGQIDRTRREVASGKIGNSELLEELYAHEEELADIVAELSGQHALERETNDRLVRRHEFWVRVWAASAVAALAVWMALVVVFVRRRVIEPINALSRVAAGIGEGDLDQRVEVSSRDEIGILQETFNEMIVELGTQRSILAARSAELARTVESLSIAREQADTASQTKSQFLANMSHEIRTPMNGVLGACELLLAAEMSPPQRRHAEIAYQSAKHLLRIIDDILDFSRIEAGKLQLESTPLDPREIVGEVFGFVERRVEQKRLELRKAIGEAVPQRVSGDPVRLRQILSNLVENAVKFTDKGAVTLTLDVLPSAPAEAPRPERAADRPVWLKFAVADTGIGIEPRARERIFEVFSQADATMTRRYGGTGLGLAIAKQLVEMMGGRIGVESSPGHGSTFWFELPLKPAPPAAPRTCAAGSAVGGAGDMFAGHVLLAEDNLVNREVARAFLTACGLRVTVAENGRRAVEKVAAGHFDLVLMDCQMPEMDGFEATRRIRKMQEGGERTPIIALTANALEGDRERCLEAGMDDYLAKPISREQLAALLGRWLPSPQGPATSAT